MLMLDFTTDFSSQKSRALSRAMAENRLHDRLFKQKKSSIESSIGKPVGGNRFSGTPHGTFAYAMEKRFLHLICYNVKSEKETLQ